MLLEGGTHNPIPPMGINSFERGRARSVEPEKQFIPERKIWRG